MLTLYSDALAGYRLLTELDERYANEQAASRLTHGVIVSPHSWYRRHRRNDDLEDEEARPGSDSGLEEAAVIDGGLAARLAAFKQAKAAAAAR
jgi:hypothetical protein